MPGRSGQKAGLLAHLATALLAIFGAAGCAGIPVEAGREAMLTPLLTIPAEVALTLTAWPTPAPVLRLVPTVTVATRRLWTVSRTAMETSSEAITATVQVTPTSEDSESPTFPPVAPVSAAAVGSLSRATELRVPRPGMSIPVQEVSWRVEYGDGRWRSEWETAGSAAGHRRNSANPGEAGNVVLSGHHNTRGEVFREVRQMGEPGAGFGLDEEITLLAEDGREYSYRVVAWDRFLGEGVPDAELAPYRQHLVATGDARLTLVTCWPYASNTHRVAVTAKLQP